MLNQATYIDRPAARKPFWTMLARMVRAGRARTRGITATGLVLGVLAGSHAALGQGIDLRTQAKNPDFSAQTGTRPMQTGTILPSTCTAGQFFFKSDALAGRNVYICVNPGVWTQMLIDGGSVTSVFGRAGTINAAEGDYNLSQLGDVSGKKGDTQTVQMFGGGNTAAGDCAAFDITGNVVSAGGPCSGLSVNGGSGVVVSSAATQATISVDTAVVPMILIQEGLLNFPSIEAGACAELDMGAPGAAAGDAVASGWPADLASGLTGIMRVQTASQVRVRLCNATTVAIDPAEAEYRATIVRRF